MYEISNYYKGSRQVSLLLLSVSQSTLRSILTENVVGLILIRKQRSFTGKIKPCKINFLQTTDSILTAGSVMAKHDRISPSSSGRSHFCFCSSVPYRTSTSMLPVSGAEQLNGYGNRSQTQSIFIDINEPRLFSKGICLS